MHTAKIVALGYDCGVIHITLWTIPADKTLSTVGESLTFDGPAYDICLISKTGADLSFGFTDYYGV